MKKTMILVAVLLIASPVMAGDTLDEVVFLINQRANLRSLINSIDTPHGKENTSIRVYGAYPDAYDCTKAEAEEVKALLQAFMDRKTAAIKEAKDLIK